MAHSARARSAQSLPLRFASSSSSSSPSADPHPILSELRRKGATASSANSGPHLGPFPMPNAEREARIADSQRKWAQMGGLFLLVIYAFSSELFGEASPTRIFEDCVDRVKADEELQTMLAPPLSFHGSSSSSRVRRNRRISHSLSKDPSTGVETLFVRFYVEGTDPLAAEAAANESWLDWAKRWIGPAVWEDSHHPGTYRPKLSSGLTEEEEEARIEEERREKLDEERRKTWGGWLSSSVGSAVGSVFGGLNGLRGGAVAEEGAASSGRRGFFSRQKKPRLGEYTTGEVVAELRKDPTSGHFVYEQLFVAIPDARAPNYYRHNINTTTVIPSEEKALDRLRFWNRSKAA
ncbi:mitochondrial inner membrane translocase complex, subunit Tim21 [Rhodotorula toruloides]|uniref:Mitochondrial import inner membrane translocase subunit Tim21 n=1 Tax=Rhodotorula toruloides TaxID=5286 RepID=A0A511KGN1_RHOTO|nr:mitochondrial inner membrane translocase complex, subunit Tim21 [Rhodotorula toruloides]